MEMIICGDRTFLRNHGATVVGRGYHIALSREHAKRLFGQKDDENLRKFLDELIADPLALVLGKYCGGTKKPEFSMTFQAHAA